MKNKFFKFTLGIAVALVAYHLTKDLFSTLSIGVLTGSVPLLIAIAVSYLMYQTMKPIELLLRYVGVKNDRLIRGISIATTILVTVGSLVGALYLTIPAVITNLEALINNLPLIQGRAIEILDGILSSLPFLNEISAESLVGDVLGSISEYLPLLYNALVSSIESIATGVLILSIIAMICIMLLYEKDDLAKNVSTSITHLFGYRVENMISRGAHCVDVVLGGYYLGKITECSIVGSVSLAYYLILGVPYAPFFALLLAFTYLIPYIGGYIALVPTSILLVFDTPTLALWTVVGAIVIINVVATFLSPIVLKSKLNIHPITVIVSVLIGGELLGLLGLIIAPPVASLIKMGINIYASRRKKPIVVEK